MPRLVLPCTRFAWQTAAVVPPAPGMDDNFTALAKLTNGHLDAANFSRNAAIQSTKFAQPYSVGCVSADATYAFVTVGGVVTVYLGRFSQAVQPIGMSIALVATTLTGAPTTVQLQNVTRGYVGPALPIAVDTKFSSAGNYCLTASSDMAGTNGQTTLAPGELITALIAVPGGAGASGTITLYYKYSL